LREVAEVVRLVSAGLVPCAAYLAIGLRLLPRFRVDARGAERLALAWVFGTGVASLGILVLRALAVPVPLLMVGAVAVLFWPLRGGRLARRGAPPEPEPASVSGPAWVQRVDACTAAVGTLTFVAALGPETFWDGFEYHLPLVAAWTEGPLRAVPGMLDAEFRAGIDLLYVPAVFSGFPDAAAAVSAAFALALAALVRAETTRRASAGAGALAGLFTLVAPLTVDLAPSTYVDLGVGVHGFAALLFADRWNREGAPSALLASAACLAFALNAKLHAGILVPAVLLLLLLGGRRPAAGLLARFVALAGLLAAPWFVKVALTTGNPFFPFLGDWLGYGPTDARNVALRRARILANYPVARDVVGLGQYLLAPTFGRNPHVGGLLGALPLGLAPLALGRLSRATWALVAVLAGLVVLMFFFLPAARFGTPLWPWLAVAAGVGGRRLAASGSLARGVLVGCLTLVALQQGVEMLARYLPRLQALYRPTAYEREQFPDQDALRQMVSRAEPVVGIPMGAVAWMPQPVYNLLWERNGELYFGRGGPADLPMTPPGRALALLRERDVRSLVLDVLPPHPGDGRVGHPIIDRWIEEGRAAIAPGMATLPARGDRTWVHVRLVDTPPASRGTAASPGASPSAP